MLGNYQSNALKIILMAREYIHAYIRGENRQQEQMIPVQNLVMPTDT